MSIFLFVLALAIGGGWALDRRSLRTRVVTLEERYDAAKDEASKARLDARGLARVLHRHRVANPDAEGVGLVMDEKVDDMIRPYAGLYWPAMDKELRDARERKRLHKLAQR